MLGQEGVKKFTCWFGSGIPTPYQIKERVDRLSNGPPNIAGTVEFVIYKTFTLARIFIFQTYF
jgi:hypothetical protein